MTFRNFIGVFAALAMVALAAPASAQAFGIEMGTPIRSLKVISNQGENSYIVEAPMPNREFESYLVYATPQHGVCKVTGIGVNHDGDISGISVRAKFLDLSATLKQKYGSSERKFDFLHAGSIWDQPHEWAMSLRQDQRTYAEYWSREAGNLPPQISGIGLTAKSISSNATYLTLVYEFSNFSDCRAAGQQRDIDAL